MAIGLLGDCTFDWSDLVTMWLIVSTLATHLAVQVTEAEVVLYKPAKKNVNGVRRTLPGPPLTLRLIVVHRTPTVMHWRIVHRTNRTNFDPLTGTDIGPGSDQPHIYGVWSDHLRSIGTTQFGPVCPAWSDEENEGGVSAGFDGI